MPRYWNLERLLQSQYIGVDKWLCVCRVPVKYKGSSASQEEIVSVILGATLAQE